jgi:hypothetical protein
MRFAAAEGAKSLAGFQRIVDKAIKEITQLPRLFKTHGRQDHGYKTQDPVKAKATLDKIQKKIEEIGKEAQKAQELADDFNKAYKPTTKDKELSLAEFRKWLERLDLSLAAVRTAIRDPENEYSITRLGDDLDSTWIHAGQNALVDLKRAMSGTREYWGELSRPDPDPIHIPKGGTDLDRFLAFITPTIRRLAKGAASTIKKDKAKAAVIAWRVLEDVNAHSESSEAETVLSPLTTGEETFSDKESRIVSSVSRDLDYGIVEAGAFGVALMQEVGEKSYADHLAKTLAKSFAEYTTGE